MIFLIESQYFGPAIFYKTLRFKTHLLIEQYESFQKMSFRNRLMVAGADGPIMLSVPLQAGRNQKVLIRDVRIDNSSSWNAGHWKTIVSCYNRSPWFEYYRDELEDLYKKKIDFLLEWNLLCLQWILTKLELNIPVSLTGYWRKVYDLEGWEDWRNKLSNNFLCSGLMEGPKYNQVFEDRTGFIPNLSILDLLFCEGRNATSILGVK